MLKIIYVVIFCGGVISCVEGRGQVRDTNVERSPLVVVEAAKDLRYTNEYDGSVYYWNEDSYPAQVTIARLSALMSKDDWRPSDQDVMSETVNPDLGKWGVHDERSGTTVRQWSGVWTNTQGDFITYVLRYRTQFGKPIPPKLEISGVYMKAERVKALRNAARQMQSSGPSR